MSKILSETGWAQLIVYCGEIWLNERFGDGIGGNYLLGDLLRLLGLGAAGRDALLFTFLSLLFKIADAQNCA